MFSRQSMSGSITGNGSNLVEFRAGRMNMVGKMVHPDPRKGLVFLHQTEDGLMHFCWKDRTTGKVEDDLIVFPDDFEFKRVAQCKTGRVYVLKFKTSTRRMFFWMQEPKIDKDEEYCRRVNDLMNNPPSATRGANSENGDLQYMLNNMSQQQLMQLFGGVGQMGGLSTLLGSMNRENRGSNRGSAAGLLTQETGGSSRSSGGSKRGGSKSNTNTSGAAATTTTAATADQATLPLNVDLSTAIANSDAINKVIAKPDVAKNLSVHLPEVNDDADGAKQQQIKETIASPQFQQALSLFSDALQTAQLGPVISQFELSQEAVAAAFSGNLENFVKALEKSLPEGTTLNSPKAAEADEPMKVDDAAAAAAVEQKKGDSAADKSTEEKK